MVPWSEIRIKRDFLLFETLSIDSFQAIATFRNTVSFTDWSQESILQVMKTLCSDEILDIVANEQDIEKVFTRLLENKYPSTMTYKFKSHLKKQKLDDFVTVQDYKWLSRKILRELEYKNHIRRRKFQEQ
ncbi:hypothetical protein DMUE_2133 [Dictyocoela muelleri]|nr:hypothetical protein DMUE_2133 [Dictyocoela muelleri]